jgi:hypothetical protein
MPHDTSPDTTRRAHETCALSVRTPCAPCPVQVEPKTRECLYEELQSGAVFHMDFEVIRGGLLDIKLQVTDPANRNLIDKMTFFNRQDDALNQAGAYHNHDSHSRSVCRYALTCCVYVVAGGLWLPCGCAEGRVDFTATMSGTHQICFDNTMSRWTAKVVTFRIASTGSNEKKDELVKFEHLTPMVDSVIKISEELVHVEDVQRHMRVREQQHRDGLYTD